MSVVIFEASILVGQCGGRCFFFSSRRRHTRFDCDWSSDVCSSDLVLETSLYVEDLDRASRFYEETLGLTRIEGDDRFRAYGVAGRSGLLLFKRGASRSEERRVGKECRSRWSPYH